MLLAIDVGNTQTVIGVFDSATPALVPERRDEGELPGLIQRWRVATVAERTADELILLLQSLLGLAGISVPLVNNAPSGLDLVEGVGEALRDLIDGEPRDLLDLDGVGREHTSGDLHHILAAHAVAVAFQPFDIITTLAEEWLVCRRVNTLHVQKGLGQLL